MSNRCLEKPLGRGSLNQPMGPVLISSCDVQGRPSLSLMFVMEPDEGLSSKVWSGALMTDESVCLDTPDLETTDVALKVRIVVCTGQKRQNWLYNSEVLKYDLLLLFNYNIMCIYLIFCIYLCIIFFFSLDYDFKTHRDRSVFGYAI